MSPKKTPAPKKAKAAKPAADAPKKAAPKKRKAPVPNPQAFIDYPREGEIIYPGHYAIRVGTYPDCQEVEISIDGGLWTACRKNDGYWWYDWRDFEPGPHLASARARTKTKLSLEAKRYFTVAPEVSISVSGF